MEHLSFDEQKRRLLETIANHIDDHPRIVNEGMRALEYREFDFFESLVEMACEALGWVFEKVASVVDSVIEMLSGLWK